MKVLLIDRVRFIAPLVHEPCGDKVQCHIKDTNTAVTWWRGRPLSNNSLRGNVYVQSKGCDADGQATSILIDCCPGTVLQGHNVFGSQDLVALVLEILDRVVDALGIDPSSSERRAWRRGDIALTEVHVTGHFVVPQEHAQTVIEAIDAHVRHGKSRPFETGIALVKVHGTGSARRSKCFALSIYNKLVDLRRNQHRLSPLSESAMRFLEQASTDCVRAEAKLFSMGLKQLHLKRLLDWWDADIYDVFERVMNRFSLPERAQPDLTADEERGLSKPAKRLYRAYLGGVDLRVDYCAKTIATHRKEILAGAGVDIRSPRRPKACDAINLAALFDRDNIKRISKKEARSLGLLFEG